MASASELLLVASGEYEKTKLEDSVGLARLSKSELSLPEALGRAVEVALLSCVAMTPADVPIVRLDVEASTLPPA